MKYNGTKPRVAVIGSGISGISAAWLLRNDAKVTLYEAQARFGGHTHTYNVEEMSRNIPVDTGFMVFNHENYPNLVQLFKYLGVESYQTDMSFAVSLDHGRLEYAGSNLNSLFGQRRNILRPGYWKMLTDITRFNKVALHNLQRIDEAISLGNFLDQHQLGKEFREHYLYPMAAAIWSCPSSWMKDYPASRFLKFFANHGLLRVNNHLQWYTVRGGSQSYLNKMIEDLGDRVLADQAVTSVTRTNNQIHVQTPQSRLTYDQVIFACHSDEALALITDPTPEEQSALGDIPYQPNRVILHTDEQLMPTRSRIWSSWNFLADQQTANGNQPVSVTYWMNSLQDLPTNTQYFVSLNPLREPDKSKVIQEFEYQHPVFREKSVEAQHLIENIQGHNNTWFCGAWTGYGFHEDGLRSGVSVARKLGADIPWDSSAQRDAA